MQRIALLLIVVTLALFAREAACDETGHLRVRGTEGATLWVDGRSYGTLPVESISLTPGRHTIRLARTGFEEYKETIWIHPDRGESRIGYLHQKRRRDALWRALAVPGWGEYYNDRPLRGALTLVSEAALVAYAAYQNREFEDRRDTYEDALLAYRSALTDAEIAATARTRDEAYDRMEDSESSRDTALLAAAVIYGVSVLDTFFGFPFEDVAPAKITFLPDRGAGTAPRVGVAVTIPVGGF